MTISDENEIDQVPSKEEIHEISPEELEELANAPVVYEDVDADDDYPDDAELDPDGVEEVEETEVTADNWEQFLPPEAPPSAPTGVVGFETLAPPFLAPTEAQLPGAVAGESTALGEPTEATTPSGFILPNQPTINQIVGVNGLLNAAGQQLWAEPEPTPQEGFEP